ncbi:MAG: guanylate kinase [Lachnospiraceae bacterium]|jgi:Guanylate kinase|uniref:guanylate kinase n=1 Tax=Roseburia sp. 1XD42-69 TaxID=2320088 RepID=UPI000EA3A319|nr:guanylate kinase [Roseburia sp. 1XD42-69]MCI8875404.1 guanylate kinase [Lachnospiraceae bacterium]RKJ63851.1 guanylate kinase [Roseburia sp. 1XD42-69]
MGKIFCIMGKSSSGKDTLYQLLLNKEELHLSRIIPYTTRPRRRLEEDGREYFFVDEKQQQKMEEEGKIIELRSYDTVHGIWKYFTVDDGQISLENHNYLMIATLEAYEKMLLFFGKEVMVPIYVEVEDGIRLQRALDREKLQDYPKYAELCRRFLADTEDFSQEKLLHANINRRFYNETLEKTCQEIGAYIKCEICTATS